LNEIGYLGSIDQTSKDPLKMKNAIDYWYLNNTIRMRGVDGG